MVRLVQTLSVMLVTWTFACICATEVCGMPHIFEYSDITYINFQNEVDVLLLEDDKVFCE